MQRREYIQGAAGVATISIVGCLGQSDDESTELSMSVPQEGGIVHSATTALQRGVDQTSDSIEFFPTASEGARDVLLRYQDEELDGVAIGVDGFARAPRGLPPFEEDDFDDLPLQAFVINQMDYFMVSVEGSGITSYDDILDGDSNIWVFQPGSSVRTNMEALFENMGVLDQLEGRLMDFTAGELAGAVDEGRVDAFIIFGNNREEVLGIYEEPLTRHDVNVVQMEGEWRNAAQDILGVEFEEIDPFGIDQDVTEHTDMIPSLIMLAKVSVREDVSNEAVYELCRVTHEEVDTIREGLGSYLDHSNIDNMSFGLLDDHPLHPGAEEFYEDYS